MDDLEKDRLELELIKVGAARAEMEFIIKQRESEIRRVREAIRIQVAREDELRTKIKEMEKN
tara:strand:- start:6082 stop:6267 length:186 start_codon:yes stop_codon:yes gene_type:complete